MTDKPETTTPVVIHSASDFLRGGNITIDVPTYPILEAQTDRLAKLSSTGLNLDEWRAQEMDWLQARIESGTLDDFLTVEARKATEIISSGGFAVNILGQMPLLEQSIAVAKCIQDAVKKSKDRSEMIDRLIELKKFTPAFGTYLLGTTEYPPAHMKDSATRGCYLKGVDNGMWVMMKLKTADTRPRIENEAVIPATAEKTAQISGTPLLHGLLGLLAGSQPVGTLDPAVTYGLDLVDWQEAVWTAILLSDRSHRVRNIHKLTLILHANKAPVRIEYTESLGLAPVRVDGVWMGVRVVPV